MTASLEAQALVFGLNKVCEMEGNRERREGEEREKG
jgi:hypothetical protein